MTTYYLITLDCGHTVGPFKPQPALQPEVNHYDLCWECQRNRRIVQVQQVERDDSRKNSNPWQGRS